VDAVGKLIQELLNELDKRLKHKETKYDILLKEIIKEKEKVSILPKEKEHIPIPLNDKQTCLLPLKKVKQKLSSDKKVKQKVKQKLSTPILYSELLSGKKPVNIAREFGISKSAVSQKMKKLRAKNLLEKHGKEWRVKKIVKDLSLPMTKSESDRKKLYEFQTIQITIPLKYPERLDLVKWDKYIPEIRQSFKKYPYFKFTLNKTTRSIRLFLHRRYIERPEDIVAICKNYVNLVAKQLKKYDIELNKQEARTSGLHLWKRDKMVEQEYDKEDGFIGVYHEVDTTPILPKDKIKERKTWIDSTPTPDGIESNDYQYFLDKKTLEEYMKIPTLFMTTLKTTDDRIRVYSENLKAHMDLVASVKGSAKIQAEQSIKQTEILEKMDYNLMTQLSMKKLEQPDYEPLIVPEVKNEYICPRCNAVLSPRAIVKRSFLCPNCYRKLGLDFPEIIQHKDKFL